MAKAKKKRKVRKSSSKPIGRNGRSVKNKRAVTGRRKQVARQKVSLMIRRTSGRIEKFDPDKLAQTTSRSGTPFVLARDATRKVTDRIRRESAKLAGEVESNKRALSSKSPEPRRIVVDGTIVITMVAEELRQRNRAEIASSLLGERPKNTVQEKNTLGRSRHPLSDSEAANRSKLLYDGSTPYAKSTRPSSMK